MDDASGSNVDNHLLKQERKFQPRVKTGCITCRIRRVKCDEGKPECQRCKSTGRKCDGYGQVPRRGSHARQTASTSPASSSGPATPPKNEIMMVQDISGELSGNPAERRSFFWFQRRTLPQWTEFFDSEFWTQKILQMCHQDQAIKHGVLALSTMHERWETTGSVLHPSQGDFAFVQYTRALKHSKELVLMSEHEKGSIEKVLVACIIFICYENLAGNFLAAAMHLRSGRKILAQHKTELAKQMNKAQQEMISNTFLRFDLQAMFFADRNTPYQYDMCTTPPLPSIPQAYSSANVARNHLVSILSYVMWTANVAENWPRYPDGQLKDVTSDCILVTAGQTIMTVVGAWASSFGIFYENLPPGWDADPKLLSGVTLLQIYSLTARIMVQAAFVGCSEMSYDSHHDWFQEIVNLSTMLPSLSRISLAPCLLGKRTPSPSSPFEKTDQASSTRSGSTVPIRPKPTGSTEDSTDATFIPSFELSPIAPLYFTASRCRDPLIRRQAISILALSKRREGPWDSLGAANLACELVKTEENIPDFFSQVDLFDGPDLDKIIPIGYAQKADDVPENRRIKDVILSISMENRTLEVRFKVGDGITNPKIIRI